LTASDRDISDHVVVQCPACGACESVEARMLADRPAMVCRECGETWPAGGIGAARLARAERKPRPAGGDVLFAERRPLVTYSDTADKAWKAKIDGDYWPEPPRPRRLPMTMAAVASVIFLAAVFGARQAAVAALPDLAGLYAAIGLPVNLDKIAIENVVATRDQTFGGSRVTVRATLRNLGASQLPMPPLVAALGKGGAPLGTFDPPAKSINAGQSVAVTIELASVPDNAETVALRLKRRGETLAVIGTAKLAQE
jgi:hypothetical protein